MSGFSDLRWYAVHVNSNRERAVSLQLESKGYEQFLPLYRTTRRWSDRVKEIDVPLFRSYIFCRMDPTFRLPVLKIPGVVNIVGNGTSPLPIDDAEIARLRSVTGGGDAIPWPFLQVGQRVRIERGPLWGVEGLLTSTGDRSYVVVSVSILQRSVAVRVDRDSILPVGTCLPAVMQRAVRLREPQPA